MKKYRNYNAPLFISEFLNTTVSNVSESVIVCFTSLFPTFDLLISQEDFITSYTEDKYESSELKDIDIIEYEGDYYKIFYEQILTNSGIFT